ncbi:MAG TPA: UbiH/UbiF family hydroxylase [Burkholderiaceae bacterium]|nr:UbiH/UbiF family hydroxylase [Burkholderiaceae bacterium]
MAMVRQESFDVAVVGSGVAGMAAALGIAQQGVTVALIGPRPHAQAHSAAAPFDTRIYAVAPATVDLLRRLAVWDPIDAARTAPVETMRVFGDRGDALTFDAYGAACERLATIVEESELLRVLDAACGFQPALRRIPAGFEAIVENDDRLRLRLSDGAELTTRLLIGADGARSPVRAAGGIHASISEYGQTAVVANLTCERAHLNTAWQWFTDEGVVALLPLPDRHVSLVWSAPTALAETLAAFPPTALAERVTARTGAALGSLHAAGQTASFPLRLVVVDRLIGPRLALVGDAAHVVHPLAGQGLNLGLQDVAALLKVLRGCEPFRDIGDEVLLRRYERDRAEPVALMRTVTDGLARLFSIDDPLARFVRNTGMTAIDRIAPLKRLLIRQALG